MSIKPIFQCFLIADTANTFSNCFDHVFYYFSKYLNKSRLLQDAVSCIYSTRMSRKTTTKNIAINKSTFCCSVFIASISGNAVSTQFSLS